MSDNNTTVKQHLLDETARRIVGARSNPLVFGGALQRLADGRLYNSRGIDLLKWPSGQYTRRQQSYLVGRISIRPGMFLDRAYTTFSKNDCNHIAAMAQDAGWQIPNGKTPEVIREDGGLTFVIPWPEHLQENDAPLSELAGLDSIWRHNRVVIGPDTRGDMMTPEFAPNKTHDGIIHHVLIGGVTGSGKTWFMRSLIYQIAHHKGARAIILDGKGGDGVGFLRNIPGQVGPTVIDDVSTTRDALGWVNNECARRYRAMEREGLETCPDPPLYVFFSEFTTYTAQRIGASDEAIVYILANLAQKARAANIHLVLDTQYPRGDTFGDTTVRKQFDLTMCFRTGDQYDTQALLPPGVGLRPYLTLTNKPGDGYALIGSHARRILAAYVPENDLRSLRDSAEPQLREWPEFRPSDLEGFEAPKDRGRPVEPFTAAEIAAAVGVLKYDGEKRQLLRQELGSIGNGRARDLLELAQELDAELDARDYCRPSGNS